MPRKVLITGANRGLGKCLAEVFVAGGDRVFPHMGRADGDLTSLETIVRLVSLVESEDIDLLINNAGVYLNRFLPAMSYDEFREVIEVNLLAPVRLTKAIWPIFHRRKSGIVVFINSVAGRSGSPGELAYCTSKFGLKGFADSLQYDAIRANVKVLSVYLGAMWTDMTRNRGGGKELYIDPRDAALMIYDACRSYSGAEQTELVIDRVSRKGKR